MSDFFSDLTEAEKLIWEIYGRVSQALWDYCKDMNKNANARQLVLDSVTELVKTWEGKYGQSLEYIPGHFQKKGQENICCKRNH